MNSPYIIIVGYSMSDVRQLPSQIYCQLLQVAAPKQQASYDLLDNV